MRACQQPPRSRPPRSRLLISGARNAPAPRARSHARAGTRVCTRTRCTPACTACKQAPGRCPRPARSTPALGICLFCAQRRLPRRGWGRGDRGRQAQGRAQPGKAAQALRGPGSTGAAFRQRPALSPPRPLTAPTRESRAACLPPAQARWQPERRGQLTCLSRLGGVRGRVRFSCCAQVRPGGMGEGHPCSQSLPRPHLLSPAGLWLMAGDNRIAQVPAGGGSPAQADTGSWLLVRGAEAKSWGTHWLCGATCPTRERVGTDFLGSLWTKAPGQEESGSGRCSPHSVPNPT